MEVKGVWQWRNSTTYSNNKYYIRKKRNNKNFMVQNQFSFCIYWYVIFCQVSYKVSFLFFFYLFFSFWLLKFLKIIYHNILKGNFAGIVHQEKLKAILSYRSARHMKEHGETINHILNQKNLYMSHNKLKVVQFIRKP